MASAWADSEVCPVMPCSVVPCAVVPCSEFPLSFAQEVVWLHEQRQPGGHAYHFTSVLDLSGPVDEAALRAALAAVLRRHAMFRTALVADATPPRQRTEATVPVPLTVVDLPELTGPRWEALLREHAERPFDLTAPPLVRWTLVRVDPGRHRLLHTEHHLVHDGQSWSIMMRDLFTAYQAASRGEPVDLPSAPSYAEFVAWQASPDGVAARTTAIADWPERLAGASFGQTIPGTRRRTGRKRFTGAQHRQRIDPALAAAIRMVARQHRHTPFSVLFALFAALAWRYSDEPELIIGTASGSRPPRFAGTVGMFVNAVPVRVMTTPSRPASEYTGQVMGALLSALDGAAAPIQHVTQAVGASSSGLDNPLFRLMFSAYDASLPVLDLAGLRVDVTGGVNPSSSRLDIDVVVVPDDEMSIGGSGPAAGPAGMLLLWDYDTDRYDPEFIALLAARYTRMLEAYTAAPQCPLRDLPFTDPAEPTPTAIGASTTGPGAPPAGDAGADLFARYAAVAAGRGSADALVAGPRTLSHRELVAEAERAADRLAAAGVTAGSRVAVILPRSADAVVTLLACLRIGAVFCPLAAADPAARHRALLDRLRPSAIVSTDRIGAGPAAPAPEQPGIAYVIHTSGSTGRPKPVAVSRESLASHAVAVARSYQLRASDRVLAFAQPAFDVFFEETLPTLLAGGTVVVAASDLPSGSELAALIGLRAVTVANLPTGYATAVLSELGTALASWPASLRLLVLGGERVTADLGRRVRATLAGVDIINAYGVTEATITSSCWRWAAGDPAVDDAGDLPIGRPLPGTHIYVIDAGRRPVAAGIVGEIAIGGAGVALGYLDDAGATAQKFGPVPGVPGRCYLTGDLGYWRPGGELVFTGRRDNQVKVLGHRIELEEVESVAATVLLGARRAVVLDDTNSAPRLIGFSETSLDMTEEEITRALAERLPRSMIPARWITIPAIPMLAGDKPDRAALAALVPAIAGPGTAGPDPVGPATGQAGLAGTGIYRQVRAIWAEVLGPADLDENSDFFALGGHSLQAIQIVTRLRELLGGEVPLALLFDEPALGRFVAAVARITVGG